MLTHQFPVVVEVDVVAGVTVAEIEGVVLGTFKLVVDATVSCVVVVEVDVDVLQDVKINDTTIRDVSTTQIIPFFIFHSFF